MTFANIVLGLIVLLAACFALVGAPLLLALALGVRTNPNDGRDVFTSWLVGAILLAVFGSVLFIAHWIGQAILGRFL